MCGCDWQVRLNAIKQLIQSELREVETLIKFLEQGSGVKGIKSKIREVKGKVRAARTAKALSRLHEKERELQEELRNKSDSTMLGDYNLIRAGIKELQELIDGTPKDSKRPDSDLLFVLWKAIESRAGGRLDPKRGGMDQSDANGM